MGGLKNSFDPAKDIPNLADKVIFITGGTAGLGKEVILALSKNAPQYIYFTGRNTTRAQQVISEVKSSSPSVTLTFLECDQTSLKSVEDACRKFLGSSPDSIPRLDVLICNAGVMATPPSLTKDGYEYQFGINHLAHALMIKMLLPSLQQTAAQTKDARIVSVSSLGYKLPPKGGIVFNDLKTTQDYAIMGRWSRYGQSKLANVIYAAELARRYPDITSVSIHPGVIWTELCSTLGAFDRTFIRLTTMGSLIESHEGAYNTCWAATTSKDKLTSGAFYEPVGSMEAKTKVSESKELGEKLWTWSQEQLKDFGS